MATVTNTGTTLRREHDRSGVVRGVLAPAEVAEVRAAFMAHVERDRSLGHDDGVPADDPVARYPRFVQPQRHDKTAAGRLARALLVVHPRITDIAEQLIGEFLRAQSMFSFKPPRAGGQAMHEDNLFLRSHPETCLAAWIAIDDVDAENGGLRVVPGSHRREFSCPGPADQTTSFTPEAVQVPELLNATAPALVAGNAAFFHGGHVHGSGPHASPTRIRRSLTVHYVPRDSCEVAACCPPLVAPTGETVRIPAAVGGGPRGTDATRLGARP